METGYHFTDARRADRGQYAGWRPSNRRLMGSVVWCDGRASGCCWGVTATNSQPPALLLGAAALWGACESR